MNTSNTSTRGGRRRRAVVVADQTEREQRRHQRRVQAREREARIDAVEKGFYDALDHVTVIEAERDEALADLDARARRVRADADTRIREQSLRQTRAVGRLREEGVAAPQIATALGLPLTRVRAMLNEDRHLRNQAAAAAAAASPEPEGADVEPGSLEGLHRQNSPDVSEKTGQGPASHGVDSTPRPITLHGPVSA